jgi:hypothetical protein
MRKIPEDEKKRRRKKYKAEYYQKNKEKITKQKNERLKNNPPSKDKLREYQFRYSYGIDMTDYYRMLKDQNSRCAICKTEHGDKGKNRLYVDHCHKTGTVRGLLCFNCNVALGHFNDDIELMKIAIKYMEDSNEKIG